MQTNFNNMQGQQNSIQANVNTILGVVLGQQNLMDNMQGEVNNIQGKLNNMQARQINLLAFRVDSAIQLLHGNARNLPPLANMPQNRVELDNLTDADFNTLYAFYNIQHDPVETKKESLRTFGNPKVVVDVEGIIQKTTKSGGLARF